jgi:hypothetical protein
MARSFHKIGKAGVWEKLQICDYSDGEKRFWKSPPEYYPADDENYLVGLGQAWEQHRAEGVSYYIEKLPEGYATFQTKQASGGSQVYKRLFGHPTGKYYDSIPKFTPHFLWLMGGMEGNCKCHLCNKGQAAITSRPKKQPREVYDPSIIREPRLYRPATDGNDSEVRRGIAFGRSRRDVKISKGPYAVDEEGTEDVYKTFIKRLLGAKNSKRGIDQDIEELSSLDWRAEHHTDGSKLMARRLTQIEHQPSFLPRLGEVVLWCTNLRHGYMLKFNHDLSVYMIYSRKKRRFIEYPRWRAGVVASTPPAWDPLNDPVDYQDVLHPAPTKTSLNVGGYRVETLPNPNDPVQKSASKQYKWLPLRCIRPLYHWHAMMHGLPKDLLHESISYALTSSTSISLLEKFKATGLWPFAAIHCKGVYLGPELITIGDSVRLSPEKPVEDCSDVLRVESIRLNLEQLEPVHAEAESPTIAKSSWVSLAGSTYTSDVRRAYRRDGTPIEVPPSEFQTVLKAFGTSECGSWYYLNNPRRRCMVSHEQVLGRLYEPSAVRLWTSEAAKSDAQTPLEKRKPSLNYDIQGIRLARQIATHTDARLGPPNGEEISWFWADTRAEGLALESINGHEVGKYWHVRDKKTLDLWHTQMRIINGERVSISEVSAFVPSSAITGGTRGRKAGSKLFNGRVVNPGDPEYAAAVAQSAKPKASSQMAGAAMVSSTEESDDQDDDDDDVDLDDPATALARWQISDAPTGVDLQQPEASTSSSEPDEQPLQAILQPVQAPKRPPTKSEIMSNAAREAAGDDSADEFEDDWYNAPLPPARGGTDESSGGDYSGDEGRGDSPDSAW